MSHDDWLSLATESDPWTPPLPLPGPVRTERTLVRRWATGDGPALFRAVDEARAQILPWMLWAHSDHRSEADSVYYVEHHRRAALGSSCADFPMGIFDAESGEVLGATGLHQVDPIFRSAEIGWWLHPERRGQGLCREAVAGLIGAALAERGEGGWGLRRIYAMVAVPNEPSRRVCERLRLRLEGRLLQERYMGLPEDAPLGWLDVLQYAVLASEWRAEAGHAEPLPWPHDL